MVQKPRLSGHGKPTARPLFCSYRGTMPRIRLFPALSLLSCFGTLLASDPAAPTITVHPVEIDRPLPNPDMGWGLWAGPRYFDGRPFTLEYNTKGFGDDAPLFGWVLIDWMWSDLEPEEGHYRWQDLDAVIGYWAARGKQIDLRVWVTDDPGWNGAPGNEVAPAWLYKTGVRFREYTGEGRSRKREPDYLHPSFEAEYLPRVKRFLTALAARYDRPGTPIALWGVMGYGQWGEWHTLWSKYPWPDKESKHRVLAEIVDMYAGIFKHGLPCISYCFDTDSGEAATLDDFLYRQALDVGLSNGFSLARHGFIDGLMRWDKEVMSRYWRRAPLFAEGDWSYTDVKEHKTHGTFDENLDVMLEWHSNFAHFYTDAESYRREVHEDRAALERGLSSGGLGYRLVLTEASWPSELAAGGLLVLKQKWVNRNVGRCYGRYPLRVYLTDRAGKTAFSQGSDSFDASEWVAGQTYTETGVFGVPKDLGPGTYDVRIALTGAENRPRIKLAIAGEDAEGRYVLGKIRIVAP